MLPHIIDKWENNVSGIERNVRNEHMVYVRIQQGTLSGKASVVNVRPNEASSLNEMKALKRM